jgi:hypothetical protein
MWSYYFMKLKIAIALMLAATPALTFAKPVQTPVVNLRVRSVRDRTPHAHLHEAKAHFAR